MSLVSSFTGVFLGQTSKLPPFATMLQHAKIFVICRLDLVLIGLSHCNPDQCTMTSELAPGADGKRVQPTSHASLLDVRTVSRNQRGSAPSFARFLHEFSSRRSSLPTF